MRYALLTLFFLVSLPATAAENFWIPAGAFHKHTNERLQGALVTDESTGKRVRLLGDNQQVRIKIGIDKNLGRYLDRNPVFQVCGLVGNYDSGVKNTVLTRHPNFSSSRESTIRSIGYNVVCSRRTSIDRNNIQSAGLKVVSPSQGTVKVRGVFFRSLNTAVAGVSTTASSNALKDYEYSRAIGYLWGDGGVSTDSSFLYYPKKNTSTSNHFGSVANSYFGNALTENSQGSRYLVRISGTRPATFLAQGLRLSDIPDKRAFLTSVVETEGAVQVGRLTDDPSLQRCAFIKTLVDSLSSQCSANTCTDASCQTPNCAFIANAKQRGTRHQSGRNCGVYLSGSSNNWRSLFSSSNYHFVKTDRTPGGAPRQYSPTSRPAYTR